MEHVSLELGGGEVFLPFEWQSEVLVGELVGSGVTLSVEGVVLVVSGGNIDLMSDLVGGVTVLTSVTFLE